MYSSKTKRKKAFISIGWINVLGVFFFVLSFPIISEGQETPFRIKHATNLRIEGAVITVPKPSPGLPEAIYTLEEVPDRIICTSTTHLHYLELLGLEDKLVGFPGTKYIYSESFRQRVQSGKIQEIGPGGKINVELALALKPDLIIAFDAGNEASSLNLLENAGIPVFLNGDYMESTALGRAEWIKFFGAVFNKREMATTTFQEIESSFNNLLKITESVEKRPSVMTGNVYGDTWFLPGGNNWFSTFFHQAGGDYLWSEDENAGWLELSFESVFAKANNADVWIGTASFSNKEMLIGADDRYGSFAPFENDNIYNYDKRLIEGGGNDFFESAYARPDKVLADLIYILQPSLLSDHELIYFRKLP